MTAIRRCIDATVEFVIGDDWFSAIGVVLAITVTAVLVSVSVNAWWAMPVAVIALLATSLVRAR